MIGKVGAFVATYVYVSSWQQQAVAPKLIAPRIRTPIIADLGGAGTYGGDTVGAVSWTRRANADSFERVLSTLARVCLFSPPLSSSSWFLISMPTGWLPRMSVSVATSRLPATTRRTLASSLSLTPRRSRRRTECKSAWSKPIQSKARKEHFAL